jgi:hypothetical protein
MAKFQVEDLANAGMRLPLHEQKAPSRTKKMWPVLTLRFGRTKVPKFQWKQTAVTIFKTLTLAVCGGSCLAFKKLVFDGLWIFEVFRLHARANASSLTKVKQRPHHPAFCRNTAGVGNFPRY